MHIRALIFDFDGLILDTETPEWQAWSSVYQDFGVQMPMEVWADCIGRPHGYFDPYAYLEKLSGKVVDREAVKAEKRRRMAEHLRDKPPQPGVIGYLHDARAMGLKLAVASSSRHDWVDAHLKRLGLLNFFSCIKCHEDTQKHKPDPEPYLAAMEELKVAGAESIVFEDSPNGIAAGKAAGAYTVAVANAVTGRLDLSAADLRLETLADRPLKSLLQTI